MEDYLKIINDNNAQMWFDPDTTNMKREATNTFSNGFLGDSNMESQIGVENMVGSFNSYSSPSFLSQIPPPPAVNCSNTNGWDLSISSYFDFPGPNPHEVEPKNTSYYDYQDERAQYEQQGYGQQWYNTACGSQVPPTQDETRQPRDFNPFNGSPAQDHKYQQENAVVPTYGANHNVLTPVKYFGGPSNTTAGGKGVHVSRNQATPSGSVGLPKKKRFFQVFQATAKGNGNNKGLPQFKTLPMVTPNTRIIKILHTSGSQDKTQQILKGNNRVPPIKIWKDGTTSRYMTTVMSLCGQTKNFIHQLKETPTQQQSVTDANKTKGVNSKTFAPTSAVMVTTDVAKEVETPSSPAAAGIVTPSSSLSPEPPAAPRNAILPATLPHVGKSPVQPPPVFRNTIFGYKKLKYRCNACAYREATLGSLITHVKAHGFPYCVLCALVLATPKQLAAHVRKSHPSIELPDMVTVTSKYGRKRHVLSSVAFVQNRLYPKRQPKNEKDQALVAKKRITVAVGKNNRPL